MKKLTVGMVALAILAMAFTGCTERGTELTAEQQIVVENSFGALSGHAASDATVESSRGLTVDGEHHFNNSEETIFVDTNWSVTCGLKSKFDLGILFAFNNFKMNDLPVSIDVNGKTINHVDVEVNGNYGFKFWGYVDVLGAKAGAGFEMGETKSTHNDINGLRLKITGNELAAAGVKPIDTYINYSLKVTSDTNDFNTESKIKGNLNGNKIDREGSLEWSSDLLSTYRGE